MGFDSQVFQDFQQTNAIDYATRPRNPDYDSLGQIRNPVFSRSDNFTRGILNCLNIDLGELFHTSRATFADGRSP